MSPEQENQVIELLAHIYNAINWRKMHTRHNPHNIFNHRVRAASRRATLYQAVSELANYFGLQSLPAACIPLIRGLRPAEREVLNKLYTEHIPMSILAIDLAEQMRKEKKRAREIQPAFGEVMSDEP